MFLWSPPPMKKWHLSAQAPHRTQMSMNTLNERYIFQALPGTPL